MDSTEHLALTENEPVQPPKWRRWAKRILWASLTLGVIGCVLLGFLYRHYVLIHPGPHLERAYIADVVSQESPVFYRDGREKMGVFFSKEHRVHVPYDQIPQDWIDAITASEDQRFFEHGGVDFRGIVRAMWSNIRSGRVVAGGSTLTQQTAKNLYYRPDRSLGSKLKELLNALRLEAHYSKEEILEFYANQFHVSANGRGLGIASQYFFNKTPAQLSLKECAFLAGMVKAPSRYNPFSGSSEESQAKAKARAMDRTHLVLRRMAAEGHLGAEELERQLALDLTFRRGSFRYASSIVLDEVEKRLGEAPFPEIFADAGIDNPSTAGVKIITSLDADAQLSATYGLWHHLTEVGAQMEGMRAEDFLLDESQRPRMDLNAPPKERSFRTAVVQQDGFLDLGGFLCELDDAALDRASRILARAEEGNRWARASKSERQALSSILKPGAVLWVSVRTVDGDMVLCDLEHRPELQGAMLLAENGQIRAMVGGNDNTHFNRAVSARRQFGSTWKTLVFQAAFQLGWTPVDSLDNRPAVFPFEGIWYRPSADHESDDFVSVAWAGVRSENLASIWLLVHLLDRLDRDQLIEIAHLTGLAPFDGEDRRAYIRRIRDDFGVIATRNRMRSVAFEEAKSNVMAGLDLAPIAQEDLDREYVELMSLHDGWGFAQQRALAGEDDARQRELEADFRQLSERGAQCQREFFELKKWLNSKKKRGFLWSFGLDETGPELDLEAVGNLSGRIHSGRLEVACFRAPVGFQSLEVVLPEDREGLRSLTLASNPRVEDRVRLSTLQELVEEVDAVYGARVGEKPYALENLVYHPDFRALMSMRYVIKMARSFGVQSDIPQVLSMPLGAIELSLEEVVALYGGMATGQQPRFPGSRFKPGQIAGLLERSEVVEQKHPTQLIQEIRDRHGNILYRANRTLDEVSDPRFARLTVDVLSNVVLHGTGRRAHRALPNVPMAGKTGTTNAFRNAAFLGIVPSRAGLYTLGAYIGYDDNRSMRRSNTVLHGASGALPAWIKTVEGLSDSGLLSTAKTWDEWDEEEELERVGVDGSSGLPLQFEEVASPSVLVDSDSFGLRRYFSPLGQKTQPLIPRQNWRGP